MRMFLCPRSLHQHTPLNGSLKRLHQRYHRHHATASILTRNKSNANPHRRSPHTHLHIHRAISTISDVSEEDIFAYKAQRWLWDEPSQLQRRYLKFNVSNLIHAAEKALGSAAKCVEMIKLPEGNFNKTLLLQMQDGREVIAKLPNPNAGRPYYTTASEVATMDYVRNRLQVPVPKVLTKDVPDTKGTALDDTFSIGPTTCRTWFDDRRGEVDIDRGPWKSTKDALTAIIQRETTCLETFPEFPAHRHQGMFNEPSEYQPSKSHKIPVLKDYERVLPFLIPNDPIHIAPTLWHSDLHSHNIFVNPSAPTELTAIIDWQCVHLSPAFLHIDYPSLIDYDGPKLPGLTLPQLPPNFSDLDPSAQKQARALHTAQSLWGLYQIFVQKQAPDLLRVLRYRDTLAGKIVHLAGSVFDGGEVYLKSLLARMVEPEMWRNVVGSSGQGDEDVPCPLKYSRDELEELRADLEKWERYGGRRAKVVEEFEAYAGWDGAVGPEEYDVMVQRLEQARGRYLDDEAERMKEREK